MDVEAVCLGVNGAWTRGDILQGHVAAICSSDKILKCTHSGDIKQGRVAGTCSWDKITATTHKKMLRGHDPGTCCSDTSPRVSSYFYFRATRILLQVCPRDMSHEVQLVELCGTCCRDKTLQGCDVPSCALLCNAFMQQNQHFSQSQTTTRIFRALSLGKKQLGGHG